MNFEESDICRTIDVDGFPIPTLCIPKGTLLFRKLRNDTPYRGNEIEGFSFQHSEKFDKQLLEIKQVPPDKLKNVKNRLEKHGQSSHILHPNYNVFFYPYPLLANKLFYLSGDDLIFELTQDIEILLFVKPGKLSHKRMYVYMDEHRNNPNKSIIECAHYKYNIYGSGKIFKAQDNRDLCFSDKFLQENPSINGYMRIFGDDSGKISSKLSDKEKKYVSEHGEEGHPSVVTKEGYPEIVLHPRSNRFDKSSPAIYKLFDRIEGSYGSGGSLEPDYIDRKLAPGGGWTIDKKTHFYVNYESASEEVKRRCVPIDEVNKLQFLQAT